LFVPHEVPASFGALRLQMGPALQESAPSKQTAPGGEQAEPDAQATQPPSPSQTSLLPQSVPCALGPLGRQTEVPVPHEVSPARH
jgi:hypothetical protein